MKAVAESEAVYGSDLPAKRLAPAAVLQKLEIRDAPDDLLLGVLLAGATGTTDPIDLAQQVLASVRGNLAQLARPTSAYGLPPVAQQRLRAASELYRRAAMRAIGAKEAVLTTPNAAYQVVASLGLSTYETLLGLYCDKGSRLLAIRELSRGSANFTIVDTSQVLRPAVELGASSFILIHNHPSGNATPSLQDREITTTMNEAARLLGIRMLDHLVVVPGGYTSLAELGLMPVPSRYEVASGFTSE